MKIVLANCVGIDSAGWHIIPYPSRWTTSAKGHSDAFTYYPKDLGYLSSLLKRDTDADVKLVDACLDRKNKEDYAKLIIDEKPDWLIMESSTRTYSEDIWVAEQVRETLGTKIMMTGQHPSAFPEETAKQSDVVVKGEYLATALQFFQDGAKTNNGSIIEFSKSNLMPTPTMPYPEDDDVSRFAYALKGDPICQYKEIQLYTSRGCPYSCIYCVASHTYYGGPDWRPREPADVVAEMRALYEKYPECEGMFFDDEIHNANISRIKKLAKAIIGAGLDNKRYNAMCAYHTFDRESLELMKRAGYYLVRVGIETASDSIAKGLKLGGKHRPEKLDRFLEMAKEIGIEVYGTFTVGGPGADPGGDRETVKLMKRLIEEDLLSDCQISICTPQPGAPYFDWALKEKVLSEKSWKDFDGGVSSVVDLPGYPGKLIEKVRCEALEAYDLARMSRDKRGFAVNWQKESSNVDFAPHSILLFRSSRDWHLNLCIDSVHNKWPDARIAMLCHDDFIENYSRKFPWLKLIPYMEDGFLNADEVGKESLAAITKFNPDLALIPSNIYHCRGYGNVVEIVEKAEIKEAFFINSIGRVKPIDEINVQSS